MDCQINAAKMVMNLPAFSSRDLDFDSPNGGFSGPKKVRKMGPNEEVTTSSEPGDLVVLSNFCKKWIFESNGSFPQISGGKHNKQNILKVSHQQQHHHQSAVVTS